MRSEERRQVVALESTALKTTEERAVQTVAAFSGNHVQLQTAGWRIGGTTAGLVNHLLVAGIVQVALDSAVTLKPVDDHPIHQNRSLRAAGAMHGKVGL